MQLYALILAIPYTILILYIYLCLRRIKTYKPSFRGKSFVSVVVACRNEEKRIMPLLESLADQNFPQDSFEVIIADDNSADHTRDLALAFPGIKNLRVVSNEGSGKKSALRTGIGFARGEFIMTTDADCRAGRDWISTTATFYEECRPAMIIGSVCLGSAKGFFGRFQELEFLSLQGITAGTSVAGHPTICNGANLAFSKDEYKKNVSDLRFDISTGDDVFLLHSMKRKRSEILWLESRDTLIETEPAPGIRSFFGQRVKWASKGTAYRDAASIVLGIVTLITISLQAGLFIASVFNPDLFHSFLIVFILKSIPDFMLLHNTAIRYGKTGLLKWFLPSQLVYPFYVLIVGFMVLLHPKQKNRPAIIS